MNLRRNLTPQLKLFDTVIVKETDPDTGRRQFTANKIGIIEEIPSQNIEKKYKLDFDNGWCGWYTRNQIELINE